MPHPHLLVEAVDGSLECSTSHRRLLRGGSILGVAALPEGTNQLNGKLERPSSPDHGPAPPSKGLSNVSLDSGDDDVVNDDSFKEAMGVKSKTSARRLAQLQSKCHSFAYSGDVRDLKNVLVEASELLGTIEESELYGWAGTNDSLEKLTRTYSEGGDDDTSPNDGLDDDSKDRPKCPPLSSGYGSYTGTTPPVVFQETFIDSADSTVTPQQLNRCCSAA